MAHSGMATLTEMETSWTLADLWDANVYLDMKEDAEFIANRPK